MAHPYDERSRGDYRDDRAHDRGRNLFERAGEEVRSWFGGDDREHRPDHDHPGRRDYGRMNPGRAPERWDGPSHGTDTDRWRADGDRWRSTPGRGDWDRWDAPRRGWDQGETAGATGYAAGERWGREDGPAQPPTRHDEWRWRSTNESRGFYEDGSGRVHRFSHWPETSFAGRGPKGYRRSDDRIREDICDRLTDDWRIDASGMEVSVQNGEVMLSGIVRHRDDKRHAEDLVEHIPGVRDVHNNLRVGPVDGTSHGTAAGSSPAPADPVRR